MTVLTDHQYVAHVYAPVDGPHAEAAWRALRDVWAGATVVFRLTDPLAGDVSFLLPESPEALGPGEDVVVAGQQASSGVRQLLLRRHHDVLALSLGIGGGPDAQSWELVDRQWGALIGAYSGHLLGEVRIFLAQVPDDVLGDDRSAAAMYAALQERLPARFRDRTPARPALVRTADGLLLWETVHDFDERPLRSFVLAHDSQTESAASAWVWSDGGEKASPLGRYLLHAAKIRYELRVLDRDDQTRELRHELDALGADLHRLGAPDEAMAGLLTLRQREGLFFQADLRALRQTVRIAVDNLGKHVDLRGLSVVGGPFEDDTTLGRALVERLDDQLAYLEASMARTGLAPVAQVYPPAHEAERAEVKDGDAEYAAAPRPGGAEASDPDAVERSSRVFVVHGRDDDARQAVVDLLFALGLHPLEWEELVTHVGRGATPYLGDVVAQALPLVQAVVVLMTPEDVAELHPDMRERDGRDPAAGRRMQARPNVFLELGMAMAVHPERTLILTFGPGLDISDLGGRNYVRVGGALDFRAKIASRLKLAGCPALTPPGGAWRTAGDFDGLRAYGREPRWDKP